MKPQITYEQALYAVSQVRLYEEQQVNGNKEMLSLLNRHEAIIQKMATGNSRREPHDHEKIKRTLDGYMEELQRREAGGAE